MKILVVLSFLLFSCSLYGKTPEPVQFGIGTHLWIQHGVIETTRALDLAIQGQGFFVLKGANGSTYITRDGSFTLDAEGYIVYRNSDLRLMSTKLSPIQISSFVEKDNGIYIKTYKFSIDGKITLFYKDGTQVTSTDQVGIALVQNYDTLARFSEHLFLVNSDIYVRAPGDETRGDLYQNALEELDAHAYFLFENNRDIASNLVKNGIEIEAIVTHQSGPMELVSRRVRIVDEKDQWWQLSADDRLIWYGKIKVEGDSVIISSLVGLADFSCKPVYTTIVNKLNGLAELKINDKKCSVSMKINVKRPVN